MEEILDETLDQMKNGSSLELAASNFLEHKAELSQLLEVASMGMNIPLKEIPKPARQRKYLSTTPVNSFWTKYFAVTKFALMPLSFLLVFAAAFTAQATPGQPLLYSVKRAVQRAPLVLISNPDMRAAKELALSEQNLNEAEKFLNSNHSDSSLDASVAADLAQSTSQTVASVKDVATAGAISGKNNDLLNKLVTITQKQEKLVNGIKASDDASKLSTTLEASKTESTKTVAEVNKLVATVNEQVMANISKDGSISPVEPKATTPAPKKIEKPSTEPSKQADPNASDVTDPSTPQDGQVTGTFILEYPSDALGK